jgi:hypothetical protein
MLGLNAMRCEHIDRKISEVDGDDDAGATMDRSREDVTIIGIGQRELVNDGLETADHGPRRGSMSLDVG